jgi:hypothetical protein
MNNGIKIDYLLDVLLKAKETQQVYYKYDSHWNNVGAFYAYQHIMNNIKKAVTNVRILDWDDIDFVPYDTPHLDLGRKIGIETEKTLRSQIKDSKVIKTFDNKLPLTCHYRIFENKDAPHLPTAAIFCDSFSNDQFQYFIESFSKTYLVRLPALDYGLLNKFKPNVVIYEQVERFLPSGAYDGVGNLRQSVKKKRNDIKELKRLQRQK